MDVNTSLGWRVQSATARVWQQSFIKLFTPFYSPIHLTHHIPRRNPQYLAQLEYRPKARTFATKLQLADVVARQPGLGGKGLLGQCALVA
ncbi:hypothetical protein A9976_04380 [Delftia sp. UME58]|nr:hypothetical protein [Delftia sp. UME58]